MEEKVKKQNTQEIRRVDAQQPATEEELSQVTGGIFPGPSSLILDKTVHKPMDPRQADTKKSI